MSTFLSFQVHTVSAKRAAEHTRITLKAIESLTYVCTDSHKLLDLNTHLKELLHQFRDCLPKEQSLVVRPSTLSQASRIKKKYARLKTHTPCSALPTAKVKGKKRASSSFRNRVGARADRLRKV